VGKFCTDDQKGVGNRAGKARRAPPPLRKERGGLTTVDCWRQKPYRETEMCGEASKKSPRGRRKEAMRPSGVTSIRITKAHRKPGELRGPKVNREGGGGVGRRGTRGEGGGWGEEGGGWGVRGGELGRGGGEDGGGREGGNGEDGGGRGIEGNGKGKGGGGGGGRGGVGRAAGSRREGLGGRERGGGGWGGGRKREGRDGSERGGGEGWEEGVGRGGCGSESANGISLD